MKNSQFYTMIVTIIITFSSNLYAAEALPDARSRSTERRRALHLLGLKLEMQYEEKMSLDRVEQALESARKESFAVGYATGTYLSAKSTLNLYRFLVPSFACLPFLHELYNFNLRSDSSRQLIVKALFPYLAYKATDRLYRKTQTQLEWEVFKAKAQSHLSSYVPRLLVVGIIASGLLKIRVNAMPATA